MWACKRVRPSIYGMNIPFGRHIGISFHGWSLVHWSICQGKFQDDPGQELRIGPPYHTSILQRYPHCHKLAYTPDFHAWASKSCLQVLSSQQPQFPSWYLSLHRPSLESSEQSIKVEPEFVIPEPPAPSSFPILYQPSTRTRSMCKFWFIDPFWVCMADTMLSRTEGGLGWQMDDGCVGSVTTPMWAPMMAVYMHTPFTTHVHMIHIYYLTLAIVGIEVIQNVIHCHIDIYHGEKIKEAVSW